ncbi:MAG: 1-acyl-sn-glycerol-3-phosphate acyltransferase [Chloroflexi bacterium]|nr:1-acyl-sn-glycerol-3-phosphate acyltransferase [Chloroflexota bacterium]
MNIRWFYYIARFWVRVGLLIGTRWHIKGKQNIPANGPLLIVANHLNLVDPPLLSVSIDRATYFMAKEELFKARFTGYFIGSFGAFPVHRSQADTKAVKQALKILADGFALVVFPEATRSATAQLQPAFAGSALIALRSGAPILPIGITGTETMNGKTWPLRRPRVTVNIGKPFHLPSTNGRATKAELAAMTNFIMERIAEQLPEEYRGHYCQLSQPSAAVLPPLPLRERIEVRGHKKEDTNAVKN